MRTTNSTDDDCLDLRNLETGSNLYSTLACRLVAGKELAPRSHSWHKLRYTSDVVRARENHRCDHYLIASGQYGILDIGLDHW